MTTKRIGASGAPGSPQRRMSGTSAKYEYAAKTLLAGGVAGCCAKTVTAPLDRLKILVQAKNIHYLGQRPRSSFFAIRYKEGLLGYFKGNGAMMVRIFPYAAIQFASYEQYKKILWSLHHIGPLNKIATGSLAGMTAVTFTYPLDLVRARLAYQVNEEYYRGIIQSMKQIVVEEGGIRSLYRGYYPTILGMIPYAGVAFYSYEMMKFVGLNHLSTFFATPGKSGDLRLSIVGSLVCGSVSGLTAQIVSYPMDVVRRRMQLIGFARSGKPFKSWWTTLISVYHEDGIYHGLFRGLSLNFVRMVPQVAVSFTVYEQGKRFLNVADPP